MTRGFESDTSPPVGEAGAALQVSDLSKTYSPPPAWLKPLVRSATTVPRSALVNVTFQSRVGEVVGLVGENGAGKTTLFRCVSGLLAWESGIVLVDGISMDDDQALAASQVGVVLEGETGLYGRLTGRQNLEFFGGLYGLSKPELRSRAEELLDVVGLAGHDGLVFGFSSGMRVRLSIARALLAGPKLLLLDEPTRSLDSRYQDRVASIVSRHAGSGGSVMFSSHDLSMVLQVCHRVLVLHQGELTHVFDLCSQSVSVEDLGAAVEGHQ